MSERILGGVMKWKFYDSNMAEVMTATALTDSGISATVSEDVVRAGDSNARIGSIFYDSDLAMTLTSSVFNMEYLATKWSADTTMSSDVQKTETVTITVDNEITVSGTPVAFPGTSLVVGSYKEAGSSALGTNITFSGSTATATGVSIGETYCVTYFVTDASAKEIIVPSAMIPKVLYGVGIANEFKSGTDNSVQTSSSVVGKLQVIVPQFQFDPNADLALTSSGHSDVSLGGNALINYSTTCTDGGYYAIISETSADGDPFANCIAIGIKDGDVELAVAETETLQVYGFYNDGTSPSLLDNSLLTFTSETPATATVTSNGGVVTAVATGTTVIDVVVTSKTSLATNCVVTVA